MKPRKISDDIRAACVTFLKAGKLTAREIGNELNVSPSYVCSVRVSAGLPAAYRGCRRMHAPEPTREGMPTCKCGLLLPCTCAEEDAERGRPRRAEDWAAQVQARLDELRALGFHEPADEELARNQFLNVDLPLHLPKGNET